MLPLAYTLEYILLVSREIGKLLRISAIFGWLISRSKQATSTHAFVLYL
jgi:hypothetical protein